MTTSFQKKLQTATSRLDHRGPDNTSYMHKGSVFLGHTRLAIQDVRQQANQPMWDKDQKVCLIFNGEIYNFEEMAASLKKVTLKTRSDTEVLLHYYMQHGIRKTLNASNGMFAFAIYDTRVGKVFLARDRLGIKPLVYMQNKDSFIFASEQKAIKQVFPNQKIRRKSLRDVLLHRYVPGPHTMYEDIKKVMPGCMVEIDIATLKSKHSIFWKLEHKPTNISEEDAVQKTRTLLEQSVKRRLISDVPVGCFLSGGIDSSTIARYAMNHNKNLQAYTVNVVNQGVSEVQDARLVAKHIDMHLNVIDANKSEFHDLADEIFVHMDEPLADSSLFATYLLCKKIRDAGIKVALAGDGADELFYGYSWHKNFATLENITRFRSVLGLLPSITSSIRRAKELSVLPRHSAYKKLHYDRFDCQTVNNLLGDDVCHDEADLYAPYFAQDHSLKACSTCDLHSFLPNDILYKVDVASMAFGLEVRVPFLDHELVEFVYNLPTSLVFKGQEQKYLLKKMMSPLLPDHTLAKKKQGFSAPVTDWISESMQKTVLSGSLVKDNILNKNVVAELINKGLPTGEMWQLYVLEKWYTLHAK